jgi:ApbE superfamily uncharacterized protein (UPF0280 family)
MLTQPAPNLAVPTRRDIGRCTLAGTDGGFASTGRADAAGALLPHSSQ